MKRAAVIATTAIAAMVTHAVCAVSDTPPTASSVSHDIRMPLMDRHATVEERFPIGTWWHNNYHGTAWKWEVIGYTKGPYRLVMRRSDWEEYTFNSDEGTWTPCEAPRRRYATGTARP